MNEKKAIEIFSGEIKKEVETIIQNLKNGISDCAERKNNQKRIYILKKIESDFEDLIQYRDVGSVWEVSNLKRKMYPEKPIDHRAICFCPNCLHVIIKWEDFPVSCPDCNQRLDWKEKREQRNELQ